ncbi:MAG TPA: DUF6677 family protein [Sedimentisphaerales bacterium]|nr:DUF6677 family protein [Sedimentisphaerales bacterium]
MARYTKEKQTLFLLIVGLLAWLVPGAGHFVLKEKKRSIIIFVTIVLTFCVGIYIGSIGVINLFGATPWYVVGAQVMNSPIVLALGHLTRGGAYPVHGWPNEIGQIYTSTAGLLNLLCVVNAVYLAHLRGVQTAGG